MRIAFYRSVLAFSILLTGCASSPINSVTATASTEKTSAGSPVSQEDIQWALALQEMVSKQGYSATPQEMEAYEKIYRALASQTQPTVLRPPVSTSCTRIPLPAPHRDDEVQWALDILKSVRSGCVPTDSEVTTYERIVSQHAELQADNSANPSANGNATLRLPQIEAVANRGLSVEELAWMQEITQRIQSDGYKPTEKELALYTLLFKRNQATSK